MDPCSAKLFSRYRSLQPAGNRQCMDQPLTGSRNWYQSPDRLRNTWPCRFCEVDGRWKRPVHREPLITATSFIANHIAIWRLNKCETCWYCWSCRFFLQLPTFMRKLRVRMKNFQNWSMNFWKRNGDSRRRRQLSAAFIPMMIRWRVFWCRRPGSVSRAINSSLRN